MSSNKALIKKSQAELQDSLTAYLQQIGSIPVLTRAEERELAERWYRDRDPDAGKKLVISNLRFVVKIAREYNHYGFKLSDLIQEGNMGLLHAVDKYNPDKGYRLISYAVWWIRAYIQSFILRSWSMVRIGTTRAHRRVFGSLQKARKKIAAMNAGEPVDQKQLAEELNVSEQDLENTLQKMKMRDLSLEQPVSYSDGLTVGDSLSDETPSVEEQMISMNLSEHVRKKLDEIYDELKPRERYLLENRLLSDNPKTLEAIGQEFGITRERVRQIEERLKKKLQKALLPALQYPGSIPPDRQIPE